MRTMHRAGAGLLAVALAVGVAACGDDDDNASTTTTEASAENAAFCDGVVDFNSAISASELDDDATEADVKAAGGELAPLAQTLVDEAPNDDIAEAASGISAVVGPLEEGDATAFNDDSTFESYIAFVQLATEECQFTEVKVVGKDYAFEAPDTIEAGTVSFNFSAAAGGEDHEMIVFSKAPGVDLTFKELLDLPEEEAQEKAIFTTAAFAPAGETATSLAKLTPGDYAMVCFIPVGGGEDGPPHFTEGMLHEFTVE